MHVFKHTLNIPIYYKVQVFKNRFKCYESFHINPYSLNSLFLKKNGCRILHWINLYFIQSVSYWWTFCLFPFSALKPGWKIHIPLCKCLSNWHYQFLKSLLKKHFPSLKILTFPKYMIYFPTFIFIWQCQPTWHLSAITFDKWFFFSCFFFFFY